MVQALEAKGERPLVVIAEKYVDRVEDHLEHKWVWFDLIWLVSASLARILEAVLYWKDIPP